MHQGSEMRNAVDLKTDQTKKLIKRINFLKNNKPDADGEIEFLTQILNDMDVKDEDYESRPKLVNFKNSKDDEWYFQQMQQWLKRHPTVLGSKTGRSTIYKYTLHFFVEHIVLNPDNAKLTESQLAERINSEKTDTNTKNIELKIEQLEEMTSFIMALLFKQFDYVPEEVNERGMIGFAINSMNEFGFDTNVAASEINPNEQLGKTFRLYRALRSRDKQLIKKVNQRGGIHYD